MVRRKKLKKGENRRTEFFSFWQSETSGIIQKPMLP